MSKSLIKKKQIRAAHLKQLLEEVKQYLPEWLNSPTSLFLLMINFINDFTILICYLILLGHSAQLLIKKQKYTTPKVVLSKWIILLSFETIFGSIERTNLIGTCIKTVFLFIMLTVIYPSKISKSIFQKYFKEQSQLGQSSTTTESETTNRNSLFYTILSSLLVFVIKIVKYVIVLIPPENRRQVNEQVKEISLVLSEERYFWQILDSEPKKLQVKQQEKPLSVIESKQRIKNQIEQIAEKMQIQQEIHQQQQNSPIISIKTPKIQKAQQKGGESKQLSFSMKSLPRQIKPTKKYRKYSVSEYLSMFNTENRSAVYPSTLAKQCTYYREVEISYDVNSAVLTVSSLEDKKVSYHNLDEIVLVEDLMVQFEFEENQNMIVSFKNKEDFQEFISSIDMYQSTVDK